MGAPKKRPCFRKVEDKASGSGSRLCQLCKKIRSIREFPEKTTSNCRHSIISICDVCLHAYITTTKTSGIRCPFKASNETGVGVLACEEQFELHDIWGILSMNEYSKYLDKYLEARTEKAPEHKPTAGIAMFGCAVCLDGLPITLLPDKKVTSICDHTMSVCKPCLNSSIVAAIAGADPPTCPQCPNQLSYSEISNLVDNETLMIYDAHMTLEAISKLPDFRWCLNEGCGSGQLHDGGEELPVITCRKCREKVCFTHSVKWHWGDTCAEFQAKKDANKFERASQDYLNKFSKACPGKECGIRIEKINGCDHMTCRKCRHEFCWICFATYKPIRVHGNKFHRVDCPHYQDNRRLE